MTTRYSAFLKHELLRPTPKPGIWRRCVLSKQSLCTNLTIPDEINAIVLDPGSSTIRAGFAGEDTPKSVIPSHYGQRTDADLSAATTGLLFGDNTLHNPQPHGLEIKTPFNSEGVIDDWDVAGRLFEYSITSRLTGRTATPASKNGLNDGDADGDVKMGDDTVDGEAQEAAAQEADRQAAKAVETAQESEKLLTEHPILMTEPAWNPTKNREKCMEIALEQWGAPAFFLSKTGGLTAYVLSRVDSMTILIGAGSRQESRLPWSSTSGRTRLPSRRYLTASYSKKVLLPGFCPQGPKRFTADHIQASRNHVWQATSYQTKSGYSSPR